MLCNTGVVSPVTRHVTALTAENFEEFIAKRDIVMVAFIAPYCGHCKKLLPQFEMIAEKMKETAVQFGIVDVTVERALAEKYQITAYPTLKLFRDQCNYDYSGDRNPTAIIDFLEKQLLPAVTTFARVEDVSAFINSQELCVVGFFPGETTPEYKGFLEFAKKYRNKFTFAAFVDRADFIKFGVIVLNTIVLFKKYDDFRVDFTEQSFTESQLLQFLLAHSFKLLEEMGPSTYQDIFQRELPIAWTFLRYSNEEEVIRWKSLLLNLAKEYQQELVFVYIDSMEHGGLARKLGLSGYQYPAFAIENMKGHHFALDATEEDLTVEKVKQFVENFMRGNLLPTLRSDVIPSQEQLWDDNVMVVVGRTFTSRIMDPTHDILLLLYVSWCGHCKRILPSYGALARALQQVNSLIIAKMDMTENDIPSEWVEQFTVSEFPTFVFITAINNTIITYSSRDFTISNWIQFIIPHAKISIQENLINFTEIETFGKQFQSKITTGGKITSSSGGGNNPVDLDTAASSEIDNCEMIRKELDQVQEEVNLLKKQLLQMEQLVLEMKSQWKEFLFQAEQQQHCQTRSTTITTTPAAKPNP